MGGKKFNEFSGSEKEFCDYIENNISVIFQLITGEKYGNHQREYSFNFKGSHNRSGSAGRVDFFITSQKKEPFLLEVKTTTSSSEQSHGLTQLLMYKAQFERLNAQKTSAILLSSHKDLIIPTLIEDYFLPLRYAVLYKDLELEVMERRKIGHPPKFGSIAQLEGLINDYFAKRKKENLPLTITGLALHLGTSRETLMNYEENNEFFYTIKRAKMMCEDYSETQLHIGKNQAGAIFSLKNFGWKDKFETDVTSKGEKLTINLVEFKK